MEILFVQGAGDGTHDQWDNKLVASLEQALGPGTRIHYPRMPNEGDPTYSAWKPVLVDLLSRLADGAVLVGHSFGGAVLLHVLAETRLDFRPGALILIAAPFMGAGGWPSTEMARADLAECLPVGMPVLLFHGTADQDVPLAHAALYAQALPQAVLHELPERDHQLNDDLGTVAEAIRSLVA